MKTFHRFRVTTASKTFEADALDWGQPNRAGKQRLSFFINGKLIRRLWLDEVLVIADRGNVDGSDKKVLR